MLNVNSAIYSAQGVDVKNAQKVSEQILKQAIKDTQPSIQAIDYSKFNRATLGIDLYSSRTNPDIQKQIALTQAGLYAQAVDVSKLNAQAAANLYSAATVQKNVGLAQSMQVQELIAPQKLSQQTSNIQIFATTDKNANSSNRFNPFVNDEENSSKEESEKDYYNLFA